MHTIHVLWYHYAVPSLYGNGPESAIELVVVGIIGSLLYPRLRRALVKRIKKAHEEVLDAHPMHAVFGEMQRSLTLLHVKHDKLDIKHQALLTKHDELLAAHSEILTRLDKPKTTVRKPATGRVTLRTPKPPKESK